MCIECSILCKCMICVCIAGEVASTLSHVMVTNPTKNILAKTQSRLADIISETQRNLSKLMISLGYPEHPTDRCWMLGEIYCSYMHCLHIGFALMAYNIQVCPLLFSLPTKSAEENSLESGTVEETKEDREEVKEERGDEEGDDSDEHLEQGVETEQKDQEGTGDSAVEENSVAGRTSEDESSENEVGDRVLIGAHPHHNACMSPDSLPPADLVSLTSQDGVMTKCEDELSSIIEPPDNFCGGDDSATPTPQLETGSMASGTITPRASPGGANTPMSPLSPKPCANNKELTPPREVG